MPFDAAITRLEWARALAASDREIAAGGRAAGLGAFERLGARPSRGSARPLCYGNWERAAGRARMSPVR